VAALLHTQVMTCQASLFNSYLCSTSTTNAFICLACSNTIGWDGVPRGDSLPKKTMMFPCLACNRNAQQESTKHK
jgi:hypothetical protein